MEALEKGGVHDEKRRWRWGGGFWWNVEMVMGVMEIGKAVECRTDGGCRNDNKGGLE